MPTGLVMIVKDEEAVIERALRSAIPFIDTWVIVDTGSTDGTKDIIRRVLADISGSLIDRPWVNFGHNRTEALSLCKGHMDWAIMLDADDNLAGTVPHPEVWTHTEIDGFRIRIHHGSIRHHRVQIFRVAANWSYEGAVHEYPKCGLPKSTIGDLPPETYMVTRCEGARSKDPHKYRNDALLLEQELVKKPFDSRTIFYLAQSWRDAGVPDKARIYYERYLDLSGDNTGWIQERYMAIVNLIGLVDDSQDQIDLAWRSVELLPDRLEAVYTLLKRRRQDGRPHLRQVFALASVCRNRTVGTGWLFSSQAIYDWGFDDELAVIAFATGHYQEAHDASVRCILHAPAEMRENALKNAKAALGRLGHVPKH
jgi:glycosyltransferase involved in cell wall biosynthesis